MMEDQPAPSVAERAYQQIREQILGGFTPPGTMLGESGLAAELGTSRTPVRAALSRLQDEGWILIYPKRGALVRGLGQRAVSELAETRVLLEAAGARRAAPSARREAEVRLDGFIRSQQEALEVGDLRALVSALLAFHRTFVEAGDNQVQLELYDRLADRHRFALSADGENLLERGQEAAEEHQQLLDRFRAGDDERLAQALREHVSEKGVPREAG